MNKPPSTTRRLMVLGGLLVVTFCAPLAGIFSPPGDWYAALAKPSWNPPAWIFGPVWTVLYILMAIAAWMVWQRTGWSRPLLPYFIQLALNALWSPLFFGAHEPGWALLEIIALWVAILVTTMVFHRIRRPAGWMMVPYLAWVGFATLLNFTLWRMNPA